VQFKIRNQQDFWAGLLFIAIGLVAVIVARDYPMGAAMRMGPGYFPTWLGGIMMTLGALITFRSMLASAQRTEIGTWGIRGMIGIFVAFILYGLFIDDWGVGFVPALAVLIITCSFAAKEKFRPVELTVLTVGLIASTVFLFVYILELPFRLFWWSY
jgi:hypothetical protein